MKVPGLVDLQVEGYRGAEFPSPDLTKEDFVRLCRWIVESGTTAFLPTLHTVPEDLYKRNLSIIVSMLDTEELGSRIPGVHIEGPFISPEDGARGAHNAEWVRKPDVEYLSRMIEWADGKIKLLTIAAELEGAEELTRYAVEKGITVSLGHQMADEDDIARLVSAGAKALTHLGNGVPQNLGRHRNPIWAGLANDDLSAMMITDGHHLPPAIVKTFIRTKGIGRCIVISDGSPLVGMPAGRYRASGNDAVLDASGRLYNPHTGYLVGSSSTMLQCMNYLASLKLLSVEQLVKVGFYNPLKLIGVAPDSIPQGPEIVFDEQQNLFTICQ